MQGHEYLDSNLQLWGVVEYASENYLADEVYLIVILDIKQKPNSMIALLRIFSIFVKIQTPF